MKVTPNAQSTAGNKHLVRLLQEYETAVTTSPVELEVRIRDSIDRETYEAVIKAALGSSMFSGATVETSVNIISTKVGGPRDASHSIMTIIYGGTAPVTKYTKKTRLAAPVVFEGYLKYAVGLSREEPIEKFPAENDSTVRFKARVSFTLTESPWRLDITAIKMGSYSELSSKLKSIREGLFGKKLTPENIVEELNHELVTGYEIEIEYTGGKSAPANFDVINEVFGLINANYTSDMQYQGLIYAVAKLILPAAEQFRDQNYRLKQLSNQVEGLSLNSYYDGIYPPVGYFATDKADGKRCILYYVGESSTLYALFSDGMKSYPVTTASEHQYIILDAEYIGDTYHAFDCMWFGQNLSADGFEKRVLSIEPAVAALCSVGVVAKKYVRLTSNLEEGFRAVGSDAALMYPTDGVILTAPGASYSKTQNYKWKPYEMNTIDFLAVKCPKTLLGTLPYVLRRSEGLELYILFVGIDHTMREKLGLGLIAGYRGMFPGVPGQYYPIQFSPSTNPIAYLYYHRADENIDRMIVELSRDPTNTTWVYHRTRTDRTLEHNYYGNNYRVAELTYSNFVDKFEFSSLWSAPIGYFTKTASDKYTAANRFKRFVISLLLKNNVSGARWVVDAAAGRGADLHRYHEVGVENALFIDRDKTAITELINRKFTFFSAKKRHMRGWMGAADANLEVVTRKNGVSDVEYDKLLQKDTTNMTVHTMVADLLTSADVLVERTAVFGINPGQVNGVVCNFALHYMCVDMASLQNFFKFVSSLLAVDGVFIFTVMNGQSIFELLRPLPQGEMWTCVENGDVKYAIKKKYTGAFAKTGQLIEVKLPFSDEMYEEPLCNIDFVISVAKKYHLMVEQNSSMIADLEKFKKADRGLYDRLTTGDTEYIGLHSYVTMRKVAK